METIQNILTGFVVLDVAALVLFLVWGTLRLIIYLHDRRIK